MTTSTKPGSGEFVTLTRQEFSEILVLLERVERCLQESRDLMFEIRMLRMRFEAKGKARHR